MRRALLAAAIVLLAAPGVARAGGPDMLVGANDNSVLKSSLVGAKASLSLAKLAGLKVINVREFWQTGQTTLAPSDLTKLANVAKAANLVGMTVYLSLVPYRGRFAPNTADARAGFVSFVVATARAFPSIRRIIIGNEPNLNLFWAPQFAPDGSDAAALGYERTLADTYDALKAVSPKITVIGGAVSPRGHDDPAASSKSHSPTTFIHDLGSAYRASGRTKPIMDWFAFHPYGASSSELPTAQHPASTSITIGDYDKLVKVLGDAFDGTKQAGSTIPIVYDEYGIESSIPASEAGNYTAAENASTKPVTPQVQAEHYRLALQLAFCQPTVRAIFLFPAFDEANLGRWQSGIYYVNGKPKPGVSMVRQTSQEVRRGVAARCLGLRLAVKADVKFPTARDAAVAGKRGSGLRFKVDCNLDCRYTAGVIEVATGHSILAKVGQAIGGTTTTVRFPARRLTKGKYRLVASFVATLNPGRARRKQSVPFAVR